MHNLAKVNGSRVTEDLKVEEFGRTQKLWIQFIDMVELVRMFIKAERSGDFLLHLHCVHQMLPIFHASAHLNYAKSARLPTRLAGTS